MKNMRERMQIRHKEQFVTERSREICMEIRIKICAPILCAAFGARFRTRDGRLPRIAYCGIIRRSQRREQNYNFTIIPLSLPLATFTVISLRDIPRIFLDLKRAYTGWPMISVELVI